MACDGFVNCWLIGGLKWMGGGEAEARVEKKRKRGERRE